jgi:hypothetical protein
VGVELFRDFNAIGADQDVKNEVNNLELTQQYNTGNYPECDSSDYETVSIYDTGHAKGMLSQFWQYLSSNYFKAISVSICWWRFIDTETPSFDDPYSAVYKNALRSLIWEESNIEYRNNFHKKDKNEREKSEFPKYLRGREITQGYYDNTLAANIWEYGRPVKKRKKQR